MSESERIQTSIQSLVKKRPSFQWKKALDRMDWRKSVCSGILCLESELMGQGHYPLPVETPWDQTPQILAVIYIPETDNGHQITRSCLFCPFFTFWHTTLDLFSVQCHSFQGGVLQQRHAHGSSLAHLGTTDWEAEALSCRTAFHSGLPLCGRMLQPLGYLHKRVQKSILEELGKLGSVPRQKCPHSGESSRLWILRLHKPFPACMLIVQGWGLYLLLQTPFYSWDPSHTATAPFMNRKIYYKSFAFPVSTVFIEEKKNCGTNSRSLCILHAMLRLYLQRWVLCSLVKFPHD